MIIPRPSRMSQDTLQDEEDGSIYFGNASMEANNSVHQNLEELEIPGDASGAAPELIVNAPPFSRFRYEKEHLKGSRVADDKKVQIKGYNGISGKANLWLYPGDINERTAHPVGLKGESCDDGIYSGIVDIHSGKTLDLNLGMILQVPKKKEIKKHLEGRKRALSTFSERSSKETVKENRLSKRNQTIGTYRPRYINSADHVAAVQAEAMKKDLEQEGEVTLPVNGPHNSSRSNQTDINESSTPINNDEFWEEADKCDKKILKLAAEIHLPNKQRLSALSKGIMDAKEGTEFEIEDFTTSSQRKKNYIILTDKSNFDDKNLEVLIYRQPYDPIRVKCLAVKKKILIEISQPKIPKEWYQGSIFIQVHDQVTGLATRPFNINGESNTNPVPAKKPKFSHERESDSEEGYVKSKTRNSLKRKLLDKGIHSSSGSSQSSGAMYKSVPTKSLPLMSAAEVTSSSSKPIQSSVDQQSVQILTTDPSQPCGNHSDILASPNLPLPTLSLTNQHANSQVGRTRETLFKKDIWGGHAETSELMDTIQPHKVITNVSGSSDNHGKIPTHSTTNVFGGFMPINQDLNTSKEPTQKVVYAVLQSNVQPHQAKDDQGNAIQQNNSFQTNQVKDVQIPQDIDKNMQTNASDMCLHSEQTQSSDMDESSPSISPVSDYENYLMNPNENLSAILPDLIDEEPEKSERSKYKARLSPSEMHMCTSDVDQPEQCSNLMENTDSRKGNVRNLAVQNDVEQTLEDKDLDVDCGLGDHCHRPVFEQNREPARIHQPIASNHEYNDQQKKEEKHTEDGQNAFKKVLRSMSNMSVDDDLEGDPVGKVCQEGQDDD